MNSSIFNDQLIQNSPVFAEQLKRLIKTSADEELYLDELVKLERQRLAYEITEKRKIKKWSQSKLAEKMGTTQAVVSRMEKGGVNIGLNILVKLKAMLGVTVLH
ncbi:helix-turn-helix transcriptional regulator [Candidatus Peregrinibacteria bacterium]|nr:helix-turn-helix transcriptional regulator [Candidatus Peregrinibacteria bacterium]